MDWPDTIVEYTISWNHNELNSSFIGTSLLVYQAIVWVRQTYGKWSLRNSISALKIGPLFTYIFVCEAIFWATSYFKARSILFASQNSLYTSKNRVQIYSLFAPLLRSHETSSKKVRHKASKSGQIRIPYIRVCAVSGQISQSYEANIIRGLVSFQIKV